MSINWNVKLNTNLAAKDVLGVAAKKLSANITGDKEPYSFRVPEALVIASDGRNLSEIGKRLMKEGYGLDLKVNVTFADYRGRIPEEDEDNRIGKGLTAIIKEITGDAVILFNGEVTVAQKFNDELLVQEEEYEWLKEEFDRAGLRYKRQRLKSPFVE